MKLCQLMQTEIHIESDLKKQKHFIQREFDVNFMN